MFRPDDLGFARGRLPLAVLREVPFAFVGERGRFAAMDDDAPDLRNAADRVVDDPFELEWFALAIGHVAGDHDLRAGVGDAIAQRRRAETGVDDRVDRADPRAGQHRDDPLDRQRHVDDDAISVPDSVGAKRVCEPADPLQQRAVRDRLLVAVLAHEIVGDRVGMRARVAVQTRDGRVERAVLEPVLIVHAAAEDGLRRSLPRDRCSARPPEGLRIAQRSSDVRVLIRDREPIRRARRGRDDLAGREQPHDGR